MWQSVSSLSYIVRLIKKSNHSSIWDGRVSVITCIACSFPPGREGGWENEYAYFVPTISQQQTHALCVSGMELCRLRVPSLTSGIHQIWFFSPFYFPLDTISRCPCLSTQKPLEPLKVWIQPQHILEDRGQIHTSHSLFFHKYQLQFHLGSSHELRDSSNQMIPMLTNLEAIMPQFPSSSYSPTLMQL